MQWTGAVTFGQMSNLDIYADTEVFISNIAVGSSWMTYLCNDANFTSIFPRLQALYNPDPVDYYIYNVVKPMLLPSVDGFNKDGFGLKG